MVFSFTDHFSATPHALRFKLDGVAAFEYKFTSTGITLYVPDTFVIYERFFIANPTEMSLHVIYVIYVETILLVVKSVTIYFGEFSLYFSFCFCPVCNNEENFMR